MSNLEKNSAELNCWSEIGDWGNGTCPKLDEYGRCKYCSIYILSGRKLFDRPITDELISEWTEIVSKPKEIKNPNTVSVVIFRIASEWLAIETQCFQEVTDRKFIHTVPYRTNSYFQGICNINGELLLSFSLSKILGLLPATSELKKMVVLKNQSNRYIFEVDEFDCVSSIPNDMLQKPPVTISKSVDAHISAIFNFKNNRIGLLDSTKLFTAFKEVLVW